MATGMEVLEFSNETLLERSSIDTKVAATSYLSSMVGLSARDAEFCRRRDNKEVGPKKLHHLNLIYRR